MKNFLIERTQRKTETRVCQVEKGQNGHTIRVPVSQIDRDVQRSIGSKTALYRIAAFPLAGAFLWTNHERHTLCSDSCIVIPFRPALTPELHCIRPGERERARKREPESAAASVLGREISCNRGSLIKFPLANVCSGNPPVSL